MSVKRLFAVLIPLLITTVTGAAAGLPASAQAADAPVDGRYYLQNAATGLNAAAAATAPQTTVTTSNSANASSAAQTATSLGFAAQHRPRGDEDHQQWSVRAAGNGYVFENTDATGRCLGRAGSSVTLLDCAAAEAQWQVTPTALDRYALSAPDTGRFLAVDGSAEPLILGSAGDAAQWYLTPLTLPAMAPPAPEDRRLDQVTFLTAHNAFANGKDGDFAPPFINLFPNQNRGLDTQLADGVRGFMFDIYQTADGAMLCHQSCTLVNRPVPLHVDLQRIVAFLGTHSHDFVTVFLEDYVDAGVLRAELAKVPGLTDVLYRPDTEGVREHGWPRMGDLAARGKGLLIFTDHSRAQDSAAGLTRDTFGVLYQREWTVENYWSMGSGVGTSDWSCYSRWGTDVPLTRTEPGFRRLFVMNHFRDTPLAGTVTTDNAKALDRARRFCEPAARTRPTFLAVDRYDLGDPMSTVEQLNADVVH